MCYLRGGGRVFETYWTTLRGVEAMDYSYALMDLTVYGRQEPWEESPPAGRRSAPSPGLTAARRPGRQCQSGRADAPSPSGRDWPPGALTTWALAVTPARSAAAALTAALGPAAACWVVSVWQMTGMGMGWRPGSARSRSSPRCGRR